MRLILRYLKWVLYKRIDTERFYTQSNKAELGRTLFFRDVVIVPYESLLDRFNGLSAHRGGPIWPDWNSQTEARHCRNAAPIDDQPSQPNATIETLADPVIWGSAICTHFGHQIADFSTRLLHSKVTHPNAKFLFCAKSGSRIETIEQAPTFFQEILDWYDIAPDRVKIASRPLLAKQLIVAPQAEQLSSYGPSPEYLDLADAHTNKKLSLGRRRQGTVFVSRAGTKHHFAGESYLETLMSDVGIKVIRPETLSLLEQLSEYCASEWLIFSEGSAIHALQLLGRSLGKVQIVNRRSDQRLAKGIIADRAQSLEYIDIVQGTLHGFTPFGVAKDWQAVTLLNEEALVSYLASVNPELKRQWNHSMYVAQRDRDILAWIRRETQPDGSIHHLSACAISAQLRKLNLSHLAVSAVASFS